MHAGQLRRTNLTAAWVWRQMIEATPWSHKTRHLVRDRDAVYGRDSRQHAGRIGIDAIGTPAWSPRANAVTERIIETRCRECLDHFIEVNEHHLSSILADFVAYHNQERPHRTLGFHTPEPRLRPTTGPCGHTQC
jgi:putative transposase